MRRYSPLQFPKYYFLLLLCSVSIELLRLACLWFSGCSCYFSSSGVSRANNKLTMTAVLYLVMMRGQRMKRKQAITRNNKKTMMMKTKWVICLVCIGNTVCRLVSFQICFCCLYILHCAFSVAY